jgi:molecular chaperone HscB
MTKNYFEFFEIKPQFYIDELALQSLFYKNSKAFHPDFHALKSEQEQASILELSTQNNRAYLCLKDFNTRLPYLLEMLGVMQSDEKYALQPDFLMEMMELNEEVMELQGEADSDATTNLKSRITSLLAEIDAALASNCKHFDASNNVEATNPYLVEIKDLWYRRKYLLRISDSLNKFAT